MAVFTKTLRRMIRTKFFHQVPVLMFAGIVISTFIFAPIQLSNAAENRFDTGIAITPKSFPSHTSQDIDDAFKLAAELGRYSVFIYQWHELDFSVVKFMMEKSRKEGLTPILGLSPTSLDKGRKELDLPASVRKKAGENISFSNKVVRSEFVKTAKRMAQFKPPYLCLATEINFLAIQKLDEYLHFVTLYKEAYNEVKKISPETKVFVSFQWEWVRIIDSKEIHKIKEHSKVINIFKPELDTIGLTTYPSAFHDNPQQLPKDYYSWINNHIERNDTVLLMEVGWPTSGTGSEIEQNNYIERLPNLLREVKAPILAWALLHDVNLKEFDANLNTVGIIRNNGKKKIAFEAYRSLAGSD